MSLGLYSTRMLRTRGIGPTQIRAALGAGSLTRIRRGWYVDGSAPSVIVTAARAGGRLTCFDALRLHGAWALSPSQTHVRVADGNRVIRSAQLCVHWTADRVTPGIDSVEDALRTAIACGDVRSLVVATDSVANRGLLAPSQLHEVLSDSARGRQVLRLHDPSAESGIETLMRLALARHRIKLRSQQVISGVGRVDFVVGDRLVIETDGYEWHADRSAFHADRERDRELVRRGYLVIRASYSHVLGDIDAVVGAVLDVVRRREHFWRVIHRRETSER